MAHRMVSFRETTLDIRTITGTAKCEVKIGGNKYKLLRFKDKLPEFEANADDIAPELQESIRRYIFTHFPRKNNKSAFRGNISKEK
jgi:hypothetical protein